MNKATATKRDDESFSLGTTRVHYWVGGKIWGIKMAGRLKLNPENMFFSVLTFHHLSHLPESSNIYT